MESSNVPKVAFFDVDRTLVAANTATLYLRWRYRRREIGLRGVLQAAGWLAQYAAGTLNADVLAERGVADVAGKSASQFRAEIQTFYAECVRDAISTHGRSELRRVTALGSVPVFLSAGLEDSVRFLAEDLRDPTTDLVPTTIATRLEEKRGVLTGRCERLCYGAHKVALAQEFARARGASLSECAFYSDSISDAPLLEAVGTPVVVNPDLRLRRLAQKRDWPIRRWR